VIVLDEQISNRKMVDNISSWYPGAVISVKDLRPGTIILDDAIPALLSKKRTQPAFVTVNVTDFWQRVAIDQRFCVICITGANDPVVSSLLKALFSRDEFRTKAQRAGLVLRITPGGEVRYYKHNER